MFVQLVRTGVEPWGLEIAGDSPVKIKNVRADTPAYQAGVQAGDICIAVNGVNVCSAKQKEVTELIKASTQCLRLKLLPAEEFDTEIDETDLEEKLSIIDEPSLNKSKSIYKSRSSWWDDGKGEESEEESDDDDFNANFEIDEDEDAEKQAEQEQAMNATRKKGPGGGITLEQLLEKGSTPAVQITHDQQTFVITQKDQLAFDSDWKANGTFDGSFVGHKACVPGCFTGDNVIVEERWEGGYKKGNEVTGIRNRVRAGVQHYEYDLHASMAEEKDRKKVVIYTTTLGVDKKIVADCTRAVNIIRPMNVQWEERDIFNFEEHKEEFLARRGLKPGESLVGKLPALYIDGQFIGGLEELQELADCGDLR